jgi:hypothetical protein
MVSHQQFIRNRHHMHRDGIPLPMSDDPNMLNIAPIVQHQSHLRSPAIGAVLDVGRETFSRMVQPTGIMSDHGPRPVFAEFGLSTHQ